MGPAAEVRNEFEERERPKNVNQNFFFSFGCGLGFQFAHVSLALEMASHSELDTSLDPADLTSNTSVQDVDSSIDDRDKDGDDIDDSAPNWAFASFVAESEELLHLFNNLKPIEHSPRLILIVRLA